MVVQQVNKPTIHYRGDPARFAQVLKNFHLAARGAGLTLEFPWASLDEVDGAMKAKASGRGLLRTAARRSVTSAVQPVREALEAVRDGDDVTVLHLEEGTCDWAHRAGWRLRSDVRGHERRWRSRRRQIDPQTTRRRP